MSKILKEVVKTNKKNIITRAVKQSINKQNKNQKKSWDMPKKVRLQKISWVRK